MFKPALVIGLGGTGVLTLRHLKAELLGSEERKLPPQVKLVALDTVSDQGRPANVNETKVEALRAQLETGEYYWIGGDIYDFAREVAEGKHSHISSWFQARTYLNALPRAIFNLEHGAGQLRQFGRLAIFKDVAAPNMSSIRNLIRKAIQEIRDAKIITSLDVFLVGSVAGGTGAGMFVDIAYLVRQIAKHEHNNLSTRLRGFLVLPEAFASIPGGVKDAMRARAFAAMRENKRFMVDFPWDIGYPMYYHPQGEGGIWRNHIQVKLFDFLYHIDGQRPNNTLNNTLPDLGVTPSIADAIAAMLDQTADQQEDRYQQHATNVMVQIGQEQTSAQVALGRTSFDSAVGTYTIVLPMHHIIEDLCYRLALEAMHTLLAPSKLDEDGFPMALATDRNMEAGDGTRGRNAAIAFMKASEIQALKGSEKIASTQLLKEILRVWQQYSPQNPGIIQELSGRDVKAWEIHIDPPGDTPEIRAVRSRVAQELSAQASSVVPVSSGNEKPQEALNRLFPGVEQFKSIHLGREDTRTGQREGGQYRDALDQYSVIHLERFRLMLQMEMNNILNGGTGANEVIYKGGKLGYLLDFLGGLEEILGVFVKALNEAKTLRERQGLRQSAILAAQSSKRELEQKPKDFLGRPDTGRQKAYLNAEQRLIDVYKNDIIEQMVRDTVVAMLEHVQKLKAECESWASTLGIGFDSLYGALVRGRARIADLVKADSEVKVRDIIWDKDYNEELYDKYARQLVKGLETVLSGLTWQVERRRVGVREEYKVNLMVAGGANESLGTKTQERNLELLLQPCRKVFADVWKQESILKYLMEKRYPRSEELARHLVENGGPLLAYEGGNMVPANYLHISFGSVPLERQYLDGVRRALENLSQAKGKLNDTINSADRFKCRLVYTLDLVPLDQMTSYKRSQQYYRSYAQVVQNQSGARGQLGRETLHLFPAEVNAARFERRLVELNQPPREFHNDVVLQLEDLDRFRLFARARAFDVVTRQSDDKQGSYFVLKVPAEQAERYTTVVAEPITIWLTMPVLGEEPSIFDALKAFNYIGKDARPGFHQEIPYDRVQKAVDDARRQAVDALLAKGLPKDEALEKLVASLSPGDCDRVNRRRAEAEFLKRIVFGNERDAGLVNRAKSDVGGERERDINTLFYFVLKDDITMIDVEISDILKSAR